MAANPSPPPPQSSTLILLCILLIIATASSAVDDAAAALQEHESMLEQLRNRGYTLFTNAIATSDLQYHLLNTTADASTSSFTIFAPKDSPLYALDMSCNADDYVTTLRYHVVVNRRHTFSDLQSLTSPFLDTLLPHYSVLIGKTRNDGVVFNNASVFGVMVDGVRVSDPDLFIGSRIAVHGIDGILVTGLNLYHGSDDNTNRTSISSPPVESPAFNWNVAPVSPANIPAAAPSNKFVDHTAGRKKSLGKKKRGMHHRKGRGHHRHDGGRNHNLDDL